MGAQSFDHRAGCPGKYTGVPQEAARLLELPRPSFVGLFHKAQHFVGGMLTVTGEDLAHFDVAIAGGGSCGAHSQGDQVACATGFGGCRFKAGAELQSRRDDVVGGQHELHSRRVAALDLKHRQGYAGRGVAAHGFEQQIFFGQCGQATAYLVCKVRGRDHQHTLHGYESREALSSLGDHGGTADDGQELLGPRTPTGGPEARAAAARHDYGEEVVISHGQESISEYSCIVRATYQKRAGRGLRPGRGRACQSSSTPLKGPVRAPRRNTMGRAMSPRMATESRVF